MNSSGRNRPGPTPRPFNHLRKSQDGHTWVGLALCLIAAAMGAYFIKESDTPLSLLASIIFAALALIGLLWCLRCLIRPFVMEVVVEGGEIRWGRVDRPEKQERVRVADLVRVIHDESEKQVWGDVGSWRLRAIGDGILMGATDREALVQYLVFHFPHLKIEAR